MTPAGNDAQRDMEQRALRNVRGLLDRMEKDDVAERWTVRRFAVVIGIVLVVFAVALAVLLSMAKKPGTTRAVPLEPPARSAPQ
jgi:hypothetical protein